MKRFSFLLVLLLASCTSNLKEELTIVKNGKSNYEIISLENATKSQFQSAEILADNIKKISGAQISISNESSQSGNKKKIYIGKTADLEIGQISINVENENIFLRGQSDEAIRNVIYVFLEEYLGCKWYSPDAEVIPYHSTITIVSPEYTYVPKINTRTVHSRLFYENPDFADQHKVTYESFPKYAPGASVHTFHKFLPEEKFYKEHPNYYALRGNQRLPTQLCLTNENVLEIVKDSVAALFKRNPESSVVSVSQDDNQQHCQCGNCSRIDREEESPAGTMIRFVNKVAEAFPQKTISTLAYQYTRKPCKTKPLKNVLITLCSIECDRSAPIADNCKDFAKDLIGWGKLTDNIRIWDYTTQFTNFLAPFPNLRTIKPNINLFSNNNAKWIFEQHSNNPSELFELRSYITAKLLWNPESDFDELLTEFTNGYYEEAGPMVKQYVDLIHSQLQKDDDFFLFLYGDPSEAFDSYLNPDLLLAYDRIYDLGEAAVAAKPLVKQRVKTARLSIDFAILEASRKNLTEEYSLMNKQGDSFIVNPQVKERLERFKTTCDNKKITLMNEMGFTVDEYYSNYLAALEIAKKPNKAFGKKVVTLTKPKKYADENPMILTDGALGGSSFYANWLGYEGNDMNVLLDLETSQQVSSISLAFLQVTNHIVFFPEEVAYYGSDNGTDFYKLGVVKNTAPLNKNSKVNDIKYFDLKFNSRNLRYLKVIAKNTKTPYWHHAAGLPSWLFADEIILD